MCTLEVCGVKGNNGTINAKSPSTNHEQEFSKLTKDDCIKIISNKIQSSNFTMIEFVQKPVDVKNGFLGEHYNLRIKIEKDSITQDYKFFVKTLPIIKGQRDYAIEVGAFQKESQFFGEFRDTLAKYEIKTLNGVVPDCYYSANSIIVMEDLVTLGYETREVRTPLVKSAVILALQSLAKLHSSGIILEEVIKKNRRSSYNLLNDFGEDFYEVFYSQKGMALEGLTSCKKGMEALIDLIPHDENNPKISNELFKQVAVNGCDQQHIFVKPSTQFRNTICHGDLWTKNAMFEFKGEIATACKLVDFQTYRYGPPAQDVMAFLHLVSDIRMKELHMDEYLDSYYQSLNETLSEYGLKNLIPRKEFDESCRYFKQFALTQTITHFQTIQVSQDIIKETFKDSETAMEVMFKNKGAFMKTVFNKDAVFRDRLSQAVTELREFYEKYYS